MTDTLRKLTTGGKDFVQAVLDTVDSLVLVLDLEGRIALFNRACERASGYQSDEVVGRVVWDAFFSDGRAAEARAAFFQGVRDGFRDRFAGSWTAKDGSERVASWTGAVLRDEAGAPEYVVCSGEDVTERSFALRALADSEARYREMFESDLTANYISTPSGRLLACNHTFARLFGFDSVDHAIASGATTLYVEPAVREGFLELLRERGRLDRHEIVLRRHDGTEIHAVESAVGTFDERGELVQINGFLYDNTKHKQLEEQYQQAQKMEAIGRLAGGVAHDFNNVLTVISGYGEFLSRRIPESNPLRDDVEQIRMATRKASELTRQLLAFSRKQVMRPKPIDLNRTVLEMEMMVRALAGEGVELVVDAEPALWRVKADPSQIEQVLMNLVANGRDATSGAGRLTIATSNLVVGEEEPGGRGAMEPGEYVTLSVADTGTGMDEETRARAFEPFFTTKEVGKGTGLGLATVYGIVRQSGGYIGIESEVGAGTTVTVYLARTRDAVRTAPPPEPMAEARGGSETILLVEDEDAVRRLAIHTLRAAGYAVIEGANGEAGLAAAVAHDGPIDILVTDVVMPGMNGRELAYRLVAMRPGTRVLFMSGYAGNSIFENGVLDHGAGFLAKPFTPAALVAKVREVLDAAVA